MSHYNVYCCVYVYACLELIIKVYITEPRKATPPRYFQIDSTNAVRTPVTQFEVKTPSTVSKLRFADEPDGVDGEVESLTETITPTQETPTDSNEKVGKFPPPPPSNSR